MSDRRAEWRETRTEDRLPWLETVDEDYREGPSPVRVLVLVLIGLAIIAAGTWGYFRLRESGMVSGGTGELIKAEEGDYKVRPDEPGGMEVEGQGDSVFATSEGGTPAGSVNLNQVPEAPVAGRVARPEAKKAPEAGSARVVAKVPSTGGKLEARQPVTSPSDKGRAPAGGGSVVQLGSFPSSAGANGAWEKLSARFSYLAPLEKIVQEAEVNGRKVFRLRVNTGNAAAAAQLCGKLRVAGEACFVVRD